MKIDWPVRANQPRPRVPPTSAIGLQGLYNSSIGSAHTLNGLYEPAIGSNPPARPTNKRQYSRKITWHDHCILAGDSQPADELPRRHLSADQTLRASALRLSIVYLKTYLKTYLKRGLHR